jgi:hypothetical protein
LLVDISLKDTTLPTFEDQRGILTVWDRDVPFTPKRVFWIYDVPEGYTRAAHPTSCDQAIFAVAGEFAVNGHLLDDPAQGLYIPTGIFITLHDFSLDAVALVLCSEHYDKISRVETE